LLYFSPAKVAANANFLTSRERAHTTTLLLLQFAVAAAVAKVETKALLRMGIAK